jgi:hypothetical protein
MGQAVGKGSFRVLWLGDARAVNAGSWPSGNGLAYATSGDGAPDAVWLWNGASPGPAASLSDAVNAARSGRTDRLGALLAPAGVRYVAVLTALAPIVPGVQSPTPLPVPADLEPALAQQLDLRPVFSQTGITVYENASWVPIRAASAATSPGHPVGVLPGAPTARTYAGPVPAGTVGVAMAPAGRWSLSTSTGTATAVSPAPAWAARFRVPVATNAVLRFDGGPWPALAVAYDLVVWLGVLVLLLAGRRMRGQWFDRARRRAHRQAATARRNQPDGHVDWDPDLDGEPATGGT